MSTPEARRRASNNHYHRNSEKITAKVMKARALDPVKYKNSSKNGRDKVRAEMIAAYGGVCAHCGEPDPIVLALDHIANDGALDRKQARHMHHGHNLYRRLRREGWPKGKYQLLCHNCNYRKEYMRRRLALNEKCSEE